MLFCTLEKLFSSPSLIRQMRTMFLGVGPSSGMRVVNVGSFGFYNSSLPFTWKKNET